MNTRDGILEDGSGLQVKRAAYLIVIIPRQYIPREDIFASSVAIVNLIKAVSLRLAHLLGDTALIKLL